MTAITDVAIRAALDAKPERLQPVAAFVSERFLPAVKALAAKADELSTAKGSLEAQVADLQAKAGADKAPTKVKKSMLLVVSATDFSYDIGDGLRATPDVPVKAERYEGNLLDSQMKAGYVVEYKAD